MDLEGIMLSEMSQTEIDKYCTYMWNLKETHPTKLIGKEVRFVVPRVGIEGGGGGTGGKWSEGTNVQLRDA